jgi:hypothetical protein
MGNALLMVSFALCKIEYYLSLVGELVKVVFFSLEVDLLLLLILLGTSV